MKTIGFIQTYKNDYNLSSKVIDELPYEKIISVEEYEPVRSLGF